jgi:hypothetical protein
MTFVDFGDVVDGLKTRIYVVGKTMS